MQQNKLTHMAYRFTEVTYVPVNERTFVVQPMKELRDLKNGSITVHGPDVPQCSPVDYHDPWLTSDPTTSVPTTSVHPTVSTSYHTHPHCNIISTDCVNTYCQVQFAAENSFDVIWICLPMMQTCNLCRTCVYI